MVTYGCSHGYTKAIEVKAGHLQLPCNILVAMLMYTAENHAIALVAIQGHGSYLFQGCMIVD